MSQGETEQAIPPGVRSPGRTLFAMFGGVAAWTLHFLGSYAVVAIITVVLAALAAWSTLSAWRGWRRVSGGQAWDQALGEPRGWFAWLMTIGVLLGATSVLTILLEGMGALMLPPCGWDVR